MASKDLSNPRDVDTFLDSVDEIENIVKSFRSEDENEAKKAMERADELISKVKKQKEMMLSKSAGVDDEGLPETRTGFSKTSINKSVATSDVPGSQDVNFDGVNQEGFMKVLEADAAERAQRRKERNKVANELKEKGNEEFKQGHYEKALDFYSQALQQVKDNRVLYTNRAQTLIKLGRYSEALTDCDWALRVFENCLKAHIHMGRAHLGLKEYEKARDWYNKALKCDPKKEAMIKDYLAEVDRAELAEKQEKDAQDLFSKGNVEQKGLLEILERTKKPDQLPLFYSGGFRVLITMLETTADRTLFRTNGGLEMVKDHAVLCKCLASSPKSLSNEELDMLTSAFDMYAEACKDNEKSIEQLFHIHSFPNKCTRFLETKMKGQGRLLKTAIVNFLFTVSQLEIGQRTIVTLFEMSKLLAVLFTQIRTNSSVAIAAASLLNNLALDKKFKSSLKDTVDETVCSAFELLLNESGSQSVLPQCITMVMNLTAEATIRGNLTKRKQLWDSCIKLMTVHKERLDDTQSSDILENVLGLLLNLTTEVSLNLRECGVTICDSCLAMMRDNGCTKMLRLRSVGLLSHILPHCIPAVDVVVEKGGTGILLEYCKDKTEEMEPRKSAIKCLTAMTQINSEARQYVVDNKGLGALMRHIQSHDEVVVGNAALCLSHCTQVAMVCAWLTRTDIIKDLLVLARDGKRPAVQQNCAILIAKLAQGDAKHLERLRELHGIEILHSCMKYMK